MSQFDSNKDYYGVLGVDKDASQIEIDRQYKRQAAKHHPDRGGSEERMKSLNEAYGVLKDKSLRSSYDAGRRRQPATPQGFAPVTTPTARDVGVLGHCLSALLCLIARTVFAAAGSLSVDLVSLAARDSGVDGTRIWSHAGA